MDGGRDARVLPEIDLPRRAMHSARQDRTALPDGLAGDNLTVLHLGRGNQSTAAAAAASLAAAAAR